MAASVTSALTALAGESVATGDLLPIIDVSATTAGSKKITLAEFHETFPVVISTEMTGSGVAATDELPFYDAGVPKTISVLELVNGFWPGVATEMTGSGAAATDEYLFSDAGVSKTITVPESVAAQFAAVTTTMLGSDVAPATDEIIVSDAGVPKTMTIDELISAVALNGFATLSDIAGPHADQAAAATAITGTGKLWYQTTTGLLGITLT